MIKFKMLDGYDFTVTINNDCDHCQENHYYIPSMKPTG